MKFYQTAVDSEVLVSNQFQNGLWRGLGTDTLVGLTAVGHDVWGPVSFFGFPYILMALNLSGVGVYPYLLELQGAVDSAILRPTNIGFLWNGNYVYDKSAYLIVESEGEASVSIRGKTCSVSAYVYGFLGITQWSPLAGAFGPIVSVDIASKTMVGPLDVDIASKTMVNPLDVDLASKSMVAAIAVDLAAKTMVEAVDVNLAAKTMVAALDVDLASKSMIPALDVDLTAKSMVAPVGVDLVSKTMVPPVDVNLASQAILTPLPVDITAKSMIPHIDIDIASKTMVAPLDVAFAPGVLGDDVWNVYEARIAVDPNQAGLRPFRIR